MIEGKLGGGGRPAADLKAVHNDSGIEKAPSLQSSQCQQMCLTGKAPQQSIPPPSDDAKPISPCHQCPDRMVKPLACNRDLHPTAQADLSSGYSCGIPFLWAAVNLLMALVVVVYQFLVGWRSEGESSRGATASISISRCIRSGWIWVDPYVDAPQMTQNLVCFLLTSSHLVGIVAMVLKVPTLKVVEITCLRVMQHSVVSSLIVPHHCSSPYLSAAQSTSETRLPDSV